MSVGAAASITLGGLSTGSPVVDVKVIPPPAGASTLPWVVTTLAGNFGALGEGGEVRAVWLGSLAQGAVGDRMRGSQPSSLSVIGGGNVLVPEGAGSMQSIPLGTGNVAGGQQFSAPSDGDLLTRARAVGAKFGLTIVDVRVVHPLGSALDVTYAVPEGMTPSWTLSSLTDALTGAPVELDGVLVSLQSTSGKRLLVAGSSFRSGQGGLWFADGQDARFGAVHGSLAFSDPKG